MNGKTPIQQIIYSAIKQCADETGWSLVSHVAQYIRNILPDYDPRSFGFSQLSKHLKSFGNVETKLNNKNMMYCRKKIRGCIRLAQKIVKFHTIFARF